MEIVTQVKDANRTVEATYSCESHVQAVFDTEAVIQDLLTYISDEKRKYPNIGVIKVLQ